MNSYYQEFEHHLQQRGFTYGGGRIDPGSQHFYVNIPKNASNFLDRLFAHNGWNVANLDDIKEKKIRCVVVLRDPVERWISAVTQYASSVMGEYQGQKFVEQYTPVVERLLFDQIIFDDHTMPQYYFFDQVKYQYNVEYFWHDSTVVQRMADRYSLVLDQDFEGNHTRSNPDKQIVSDFLHERINQNQQLLTAIQTKYQEDYRLINRIQLK